MNHTPAPPQAQPLWDWFRIDEEMEEQYKAHGDTYQFIWVRYLLRKMADEYEAALAAQAQRIAELERRLKDALTKIVYYEEPLKPLDLCRCAHKFTDEGICIRCGEDAEEWDAGCVEEIVRQDIKHEQAARVLWLALHGREHCEACKGTGSRVSHIRIMTRLVQCQCSIEAERVLAEYAAFGPQEVGDA